MRIKNIDKKTLSLVAIIILTATGSFGLGRLSIVDQYKNDQEAQIIVPKLAPLNVDESKFAFVASKNGTKYYPIGCKSAARIKPENRVYFNTTEEAEDSGLEKSSTCSF